MSIHVGKLVDYEGETIGLVLFCSTTGIPLPFSARRLKDWDDTEEMLTFARESGVELRNLDALQLEVFVESWKRRDKTVDELIGDYDV